eukprot:COSAG06_NODE_25674_length_631_cov_0.971805_1_plen_111_part_00
MSDKIKRGDPAMALNPRVAPDGSVAAAMHSAEAGALHELGTLAAEVAEQPDVPAQPRIMKKLLAVEAARRREARWQQAQPQHASNFMSPRGRKKKRTGKEVQIKALREAF